MNKLKIVIPIFVAITIIVIIFNLTQNEVMEEQIAELKNSSEIEELLDKVKRDKLENEKSENPFVPKEREWIISGPFKIDRSEYLLGEKIFINIVDLDENTKGQMIFVKSINMTHFFEYKKISFDGSLKNNGNLYIPIHLNYLRGICTTDQLVGNWGIWFEGTNIQPLYFKIRDQIVPGQEETYKPEC